MAQTTKELFARTKSMKCFTLEFAIKLLIYDDWMAVEQVPLAGGCLSNCLS